MRFDPSKRFLSLLLSALFLAGAAIVPATALAAKSTAATAADFIATQECGQIEIGKETNGFCHSSSWFPATYELDNEFLKSLNSMATQSEYARLSQYMDIAKSKTDLESRIWRSEQRGMDEIAGKTVI